MGTIALFVFSKELSANPLIHIESIHNEGYPQISLKISARKPHPLFIRTKKNPKFFIYEIYDQKEHKIHSIDTQTLQKESKSLHIVWILDATLSVRSNNFYKAMSFSKKMLNGLGENDKVAVYSAKEEPSLLLDFTQDRQELDRTFTKLKRDGKITRLYDAIYSGLYTAQSALQSGDKKTAREKQAAVVLLTDGREEASYFSDNDCYDLSSIGKKLNIPVYVLIFNGDHSSKFSQKKDDITAHHRRLKRLSFKTGGEFISPTNDPTNDLLSSTLPTRLRKLSKPLYEIRYTSSCLSCSKPGKKIIIRTGLGGDYSAIGHFRIPWTYFLSEMKPFAQLAVGLALILCFLLVLLLLFYWKRSYMQSESPLSYQKPVSTSTPTPKAEVVAIPSPWVQPPPPQDTERPQKKEKEYNEYEERSNIQDDFSDLFPEIGGNSVMEDDRVLYLRENNYRLLQLALREALPYRKAALVIQIPSPDRRSKARRRVYDLFLDSTIIGSGRWAHIPVRDPTASPVHARIKKVEHRFVIYDLLSGSGVYLNDRRILRPKALNHGDILRIGRTYYTFKGAK